MGVKKHLFKPCKECKKQRWTTYVEWGLDIIIIILLITAVQNSHWLQDTKIIEICEGTPTTIEDVHYLIKIGLWDPNVTLEEAQNYTSLITSNEEGVVEGGEPSG